MLIRKISSSGGTTHWSEALPSVEATLEVCVVADLPGLVGEITLPFVFQSPILTLLSEFFSRRSHLVLRCDVPSSSNQQSSSRLWLRQFGSLCLHRVSLSSLWSLEVIGRLADIFSLSFQRESPHRREDGSAGLPVSHSPASSHPQSNPRAPPSISSSIIEGLGISISRL